MNDISILIVDDDPFVCENIILKINRLNHTTRYDVKSCNDVKIALQLLETQTYDLIISDIRMPFINGLDFVLMLRQKGIQTKIFMLSGYDDFHYVRKAFLNGADDYLLKPVSVSELSEKFSALKKSLHTYSSDNQTETMPYSIIDKAKKYILKNYSDMHLSMKEVADYVYLSYNHFSSLFNKETGISFSTYLHTIRIKHAIELLHDPQARISEISHKVGYKYPQQFSSEFKKLTGFSPGTYLKTQITAKQKKAL